ncbi:hypothetical protein L1887_07804 [Cichorium endivia]|nr:hypothetical protein L1887_07804 [Cichorium endivia]
MRKRNCGLSRRSIGQLNRHVSVNNQIGLHFSQPASPTRSSFLSFPFSLPVFLFLSLPNFWHRSIPNPNPNLSPSTKNGV